MTSSRKYPPSVKEALKNEENCYYCGKHLNDDNFTIDHIIPIKQGGTDGESNLVACCKDCNTLKGNLTIPQLVVELDKQLRFAKGNPVREARIVYYKTIFSIAKNKMRQGQS